MIANNRSAKLGNIILKVDQVFGLFVRGNVVEMDVFVAPLKVMNNTLIRQLLLHNKDVLKKVNNSFFYVKMIELRNHRFLIL
tara:strand:- start:169 stop:414 length:246 start_codon:yes stop_codon:yes gene_type:complete